MRERGSGTRLAVDRVFAAHRLKPVVAMELGSNESIREAMVSGLAPGKLAFTEMTGNSTCGRGATGRNWKASVPDRSRARVKSEVPMGRRMNGAEIFIANPSRQLPR